ncbi:MAG: iron-containing alcohol dehydrogenase, partial [Clostridia bacterium]|nr:iron-containing alcohol dehydrogenase [Clostridia bacterium]
ALRSLKHMTAYAAENFGADPFITFKTRDGVQSRTYADFRADTNALSSFFAANGLRGAKAAIVAANSYEWVVSFFGAVGAGAVAVPLAQNETPEQLARLIDFADCRVVFLDEAHAGLVPLLKKEAPQVEFFILLNGVPADGVLSLDALLRDTAGEFTDEPAPDDLCAIVFTSGTTGFPKGVMLTHRNFVLAATSVHVDCPTHTLLCVLPLSHCFCFTTIITKGMVHGKEIYINDSLPNIMDNIRLFKPESMAVVPQLAKKLMFGALKFAESRPDLTQTEAVRAFFGGKIIDIISGGAPLEPELAIRFEKTGVPVLNGYGMTECAPVIANNAMAMHRPGSVGKPIPCMDAIIRGGELLVKGPSVFKGYYKNEEATREAFTEDGYFRTGDLGYFDDDGFLYLTGRSKNLILLDNGENVSAEQLEDRFADELTVKEVVCYGEGNAIVAEVFLDKEQLRAANVTDIDAHMIGVLQRVNAGLATFQRVSRFVVRDVPFPRNASMKIVRSGEHAKAVRQVKKPETPTQKKVCAAAAELLSLDGVGTDDNFFALGGSSLTAVELALLLNIEPQMIYDKPFLGLLAAAIDGMRTDVKSEDEEAYNRIIAGTRGGKREDRAKCVLLTGATGFLGAHILKELSDRGAEICVPVRSRERLEKRLSYYFGVTQLPGVHPMTGDIEKPKLGMRDEQYEALAEKVDTVIHTAANVHHAGDYSDLERTNVGGTKNVIEFAKKANAVLNHTSTTSLSGAGTVLEDHKNAVFDESVLYVGQHYADNVYIHSKYEAEKAVLTARKEGLRANIFRMGNLTWRESDGKFQPNTDDNGFLHRVRALLKLGIVNDKMDKYPMDFTAVDEAARAVTLLALSDDVNEVYHIINPDYVGVEDLFAGLGVPYRTVSTAETIETIAANAEDRDVHVFEFYSLISARSEDVEVDMKFTLDALEKRGFAWSRPDADYLNRGGHCRIGEGFVPQPMRSAGGTMTYIQRLILGVLRDAVLPESETFTGAGCASRLAECAAKLGMRKPMIITFPAALSMPSVAEELKKLPAYSVFTDLPGEPTLVDADAALAAYENNGCDGVIALGGGSALDISKITALRAGNPGADIDDLCKVDSKAEKCVPFIAVPTTAGTGSEVTIFAVLGDAEGKKKPFAGVKFLPDAILLDPVLTLSVPRATTAFTGIDALSHIVEASVSLYADAFREDLDGAGAAAAAIFSNLKTAVEQPDDLDARSAMLYAAHRAGVAFRRASTGYIHALAHRFGEFIHIPHGLAIAAVFTDALKASRPYVDAPLARLAKECGIEPTADAFLDAVDELIRSVGIDVSAVKIRREDVFPMTLKAQDEVKAVGYPRPLTDEQVAAIYEKFVGGTEQ